MEQNRMRKIEVQSPEDIRFLIENLSRAAKAKIDLHLPPGAADRDDELRKRVEELVTEYIRRTFDLARHSIAVNGMDAGPIESYMVKDESEQFEPYNRRLHDRITSLHAELEAETLRVTQLRREAPVKAAKIYEDQLKEVFEGDEKIMMELENEIKMSGKAGDLGIRRLERKVDIEEDYARSAEILKGLQSTLPATAHKLTRAQDALDYVQSRQ